MSLEQNIKKWIELDNNIRDLSNKIKVFKQHKDITNAEIIEYISNNQLENATIKISDGKLNFIDINQQQILTYKFLSECLCEYYNDEDSVNKLLEFIKNKRTTKTIKTIKRHII